MDARRIVRWTWLAVAGVVLYTAVVMGMRWQENRDLERNTRQREAEADREIVQRYGSGELKVLMFVSFRQRCVRLWRALRISSR